MPSTQLTDARQSLWDALTNWPATSTWKQYLAESDPNLQIERGPSGRNDLPAIKIGPSQLKFEWQTQLYMRYSYVLDVTVWMKTLTEIEAAMQDVWEGIIKSAPAGELPYTRDALAKPPDQLGIAFALKAIGKESKLLVWTGVMTVGLVTENRPHG